MGIRKVFSLNKDSIIPNILEHTETSDNALLALYVIAYFSSDFNDSEQYVLIENVHIYEKNMIDVFGEDINNAFIERVRETVSRLNNQSILFNDGGFMSITMKGKEIWNMLRSDSVLLEVFREDRYRDAEKSRPDAMQSSEELIFRVHGTNVLLNVLLIQANQPHGRLSLPLFNFYYQPQL